MNNTILMNEENTILMNEEESKKNRLSLRKNTRFEGKNEVYEIQADSEIGSGGESKVYLAKRVSDGEQVVAKIYDTFPNNNPTDDEHAKSAYNNIIYNRKKVLDFLSKNLDYKKTHIMPLLDEGTILMTSDNGEDFSKPIDIIPYCKDGELKQCNYEMLRNKVIPEILQGLNTLHNYPLIHGDIKPKNIYMLNGEVVIADFGTSGVMDTSNKSDFISIKHGTLGYAAPETWQGYADVLSDYYSFGCTIATLYKGEHVYQRFLGNKADKRPANRPLLSKSMRQEGLPLGCPDRESALQSLVSALIVLDSKGRAGYDDVNLWLKEPASFISIWKNKQRQNNETPSLDFKFNNIVYNDEADLTDAMLKQWEIAKRLLYRGIIFGFFSQKNPTLADEIVDIVGETAENHNLGLAKFLHQLNTANKPNKPKCPIYWNGKAYGKLSDISTAIANKEADENSITAMLRDKFLSWKFSNTQENTNQNTIDAIKEIENITAIYPQLGYYAFMYRFAPDTDKKISTPDKIFEEITNKKNDWYETARELVSDDMMLAKLVYLGCKKNVSYFKMRCSGEFISENESSDLDSLYWLFEEICENKTYVHEHYLQYGPQAYLYWLQQNLSLYSFNSAQAKEIERQIKNIKIDKKMSLDKIRESFMSLRAILLNDFMRLFQNNYLLTYMGIRTGKDTNGITTQNTHAFFVGDFFGTHVPVGYIKAINYKAENIYE